MSGLSPVDRTGLLLLSKILAARCEAGAGFEVAGLSLQVAALVLKDFASPAPLTALDSQMHAPANDALALRKCSWRFSSQCFQVARGERSGCFQCVTSYAPPVRSDSWESCKSVHGRLPASRSGSSLLFARLQDALEGHELSSCSLALPLKQGFQTPSAHHLPCSAEFCCMLQATILRGTDWQEAVDCWMPRLNLGVHLKVSGSCCIWRRAK